MLSMGPVLDLAGLQMAFASLVRHAEPKVLPSFMLWVDLRVSEFKVTGTLPPALRIGAQDLYSTVSMATDDLQKRCGDTAESSGTQTSPTVQASVGCAKSSLISTPSSIDGFDSITRGGELVQTVPTDLSMRNKHRSNEPYRKLDFSPKSVIDGMVKKEQMSDVHYGQWPSHMSLPVVLPSMPPSSSTVSDHHAKLAKLVSNPTMCAEETNSASTNDSLGKPEKRSPPKPEDFPHKKFRPDISVPSEEAVSLKENVHSPPECTKEGSYYPVKTEPVSPMKDGTLEKDSDRQMQEVGTSPNTTSALRELLTGKMSSDERLAPKQEGDRSSADEKTSMESYAFGGDLSQVGENEEELYDRSRQLNTCQVCGQSFHYRSSFRRHMKVHQGIFSHVCAVCGRKFTRKEHFVRHKCSRKPNKASRGGAQLDGPVTPGVTPKVEFPPTQSPDWHGSETGHEGLCQEWTDATPVTPPKTSHLCESRRKTSIPRKVVMVDEHDLEISYDDDPVEEDSFPECFKAEGKVTPNKGSASPVRSLQKRQYNGKISRHPKRGVKEEKGCSSEMQKSFAIHKKSASQFTENTIAANDYPDKHQCNWMHGDYSEALDLSCPQVSSSCSPPQLVDHLDSAASSQRIDYNVTLPAQQEFTIETGSYKVVTGAGSEMEQGPRNKFIKVVKQGNYLKLKDEAQVIGGRLCFVCPTCSKIFHRSSNFSRHMRIHRGVYSYVCPSCQRGFFRREHFQKHKCSRRGMSHTWDRKTKIDMVLAANESLLDGSDAEGGSEHADSEESYTLCSQKLNDQKC